MQRVVIIGGGAIGSAIAYFILADRAFRGEVTVIERDPSYARASSALSASSIRQQFSTAINIEIGRFGIGFLREAGERLTVDGDAPDIGLTEPGYLFLASHAGASVLERSHGLQRALGVDVALLEPRELRSRFHWLATDGIALGSLGLSGEGWFDGYGLLQAFRRKARSLGARYLDASAAGFTTSRHRVTGVVLADGATLDCDVAVNAAGPWAAAVARWLGIDLPVRARRRCVFVFNCPTPVVPCPLVVDPSGVWFRPEGRGYICGVSPDPGSDPDDAPLDVDHTLFDEVIWPALAARVPAFEALRQTSAWAGYYEFNTFDQNGIVGFHPEWGNFALANGFSGHGIQQSPAVGRGIAELVVHGGYRTLDLSPLGFGRIAAGRPLTELAVV
ncbi:MAG: FAD-binding oxidoreductase [Burkholderiales bacterium]|nr:FAD-binding oxidoreductase [Burkholderiales bacterium]